jgi:hypothetical protein
MYEIDLSSGVFFAMENVVTPFLFITWSFAHKQNHKQCVLVM